jgi:hypothetical protein
LTRLGELATCAHRHYQKDQELVIDEQETALVERINPETLKLQLGCEDHLIPVVYEGNIQLEMKQICIVFQE